MKILATMAFAIIMVCALWYGFQKEIDSRCAYYQKLGIIDTQLCPSQKTK